MTDQRLIKLREELRWLFSPNRIFLGHGTRTEVIESVFAHGLGVNQSSLAFTTTTLFDPEKEWNQQDLSALTSWPPSGILPVVIIMSLPRMEPQEHRGFVQYLKDVLVPTDELPDDTYLRRMNYRRYLPSRYIAGAVICATGSVMYNLDYAPVD